MAYDGARGEAVLFGGVTNDQISLGDTWGWNGISWRAVSSIPTAPGPPICTFPGLAYDSTRQRVVLFGGSDGSFPLGGTWEWDGHAWSGRSPATSPPARSRHMMAYDAARGRVVLFGGYSNGWLGDTWEWDGTNWRSRATNPSPTARSDHALAFAPRLGRTLLFGGNDFANHPSSETWEYLAPCDAIGPGHASGSLAIGCTTVPQVGASFCVGFANPAGAGATVLLLGAGPCAVPPLILLPPLVCSSASFYVAPLAILAGGEPGLYCFAVPASAGLAGANLCVQGASLETTCVRATDGFSVTVQP